MPSLNSGKYMTDETVMRNATRALAGPPLKKPAAIVYVAWDENGEYTKTSFDLTPEEWTELVILIEKKWLANLNVDMHHPVEADTASVVPANGDLVQRAILNAKRVLEKHQSER